MIYANRGPGPQKIMQRRIRDMSLTPEPVQGPAPRDAESLDLLMQGDMTCHIYIVYQRAERVNP